MGGSVGQLIERAAPAVIGGAIGGPVGAGIGGAIGGASRGGGAKGALIGGGLGYGGSTLFGGAPTDAATAGAAEGLGGGGRGLIAPSNAGDILGGGSSEELLRSTGGGIRPGGFSAEASGITGGGVLPKEAGFGALDFSNMNFSPAAMEALQTGGRALPGLVNPQGIDGGGLRAPSASSGSSGGGIRPPAGAPISAPASAGASQAGVQAGAAQGGGEQGFVDKMLKQMKDNALGLGLIGGATLLSAGQQRGMPNKAQFEGLGAEAAATAQQLMQQYRSGQLSPGQQASVDQLTQSTKNQINQYFASIGQSDSTAHAQALAQVDQQALGMKQQMLDGALQNGLSAIGVAQGPLSTVAQYQLGQDQQLSQAFSNFAGSVGNLFGRQAGQPTQSEKPRTASPTITSAMQ